MALDERERDPAPSDMELGDTPSSAQLSSLDDRIDIVLRLLPRMRSLSPTDLQTLAVQLRILSNMAEAWAQRTPDTDHS